MAQQSVSTGQLLTAIEIARDGLTRFGKTKVLQQQLALALAQTGALDAAQEVLAELMKESARDEETLSLLGRVHKELWRRATEAPGAAAALQKSCTYYGEAFEVSSRYYPGINLAFTLAASGEFARAAETARKVEKICRAKLKEGGANKVDGWLVATLAESLVHQGENAEASQLYRQAAGIFSGRWRDIASMRRQAREVLRFVKERPPAASRSYDLNAIRRRARGWLGRAEPGEEWLDRCFDFPSVVVFSGHMIDQPGRTPPRFPPEREAAVREQIRLHLLQIKAGVGYSSAASGGDIIFCECLLEMEAKVNLVLPCSVEAFKRQSVAFAGPEWERRFHHVLANCNSCTAANPTGNAVAAPQAATPVGLVYANRIATGLAALQARALDLELQAVALWDGGPADLPGGTASVVEDWERQNIRPHVIRPDGGTGAPDSVRPAATAPAAEEAVPAGEGAPLVQQEIKAMLYAQVINFAQIAESQMPAFVEHFKGALARVMAEQGVRPIVAESSGGVNFFVYDDCEVAGRFALTVRDRIVHTSWVEHGLPASLGIRILLHAGPVFTFIDPTLQRLTCAGAHVNRAARIEAVAPRNQVYVTQEFAALCGAEGVSAFSFEYLGFLRTTMMFEDAALYRLDRGPDSSSSTPKPFA